jgi:hypothetical protein
VDPAPGGGECRAIEVAASRQRRREVPFASPVGYIDNTDPIPGRPEFHLLTILKDLATAGRHSIAIQVNAEITAGLRDDFVLKRIEAHDSIGAKIGW